MEISIRKIAKAFIYGSLFGIGSPIPGVSAGTLAILLNVYDKFFSSINKTAAKKNLLAIISFLLGWAAGLFAVSRVMMFLFDYHGRIIAFIFMGLILGCVPMIYKKARADKVKIRNVIIALSAFAFMIILAFYGGDLSANSTLEQLGGISFSLLAWLFFASFISSMAMLIPGVGGSLMMLVFGIYTVYIEAVAELNLILLTVFGSSMVLGVLAGIVITKKLLEHSSQALYFAILGFIIGSLVIIYPGFYMNTEGLISAVLACLCLMLAFWLSKKE